MLRIEHSGIPSPVSTHGYYEGEPVKIKKIRYDGTKLPYFVMKNGGNPDLWKEVLDYNQIGSIFELEEGIMLAIPQDVEVFKTHPEA
jgi:hypothetical protein